MVPRIPVKDELPSCAVCFAGLLPHAPILVPSVGGTRGMEAACTVAAMRELAAACVRSRPRSVVLISPHSPRRRSAFGCWDGPRVHGSLAQFHAPGATVDLPVDAPLRAAIATVAARRGLAIWRIPADDDLDHGAVVPLWFLAEAGWAGPTVVLSLNFPGEGGCPELGEAIATAAADLGRRIAVIASGDMSHRLRPGAPAGYDPHAHQSDEQFIAILRQSHPKALLGFDPELLELAAEDALDSTVVALAATGWRNDGRQVLSYEAPFGVGYGVAELCNESPHSERNGTEDAGFLPSIARRSIEAALNSDPDAAPLVPALHPFARRKAGVFVTLHTADGELRGCVGTTAPQHANVVEEVWHNARLAAFHDRRFSPVEAHELQQLQFAVSLLEPAEDIDSPVDLNPQVYGVIVSGSGHRRGLLLPGIEGIDSIPQQLEIARRKAGIGPHEPVSLQRFRTVQFSEERARAIPATRPP